ncbi:hypothetical protein ESCO_003472 [Escovopsis weberi]|uniref:Uncharacterized protein n=1 Tax=Escovopsis weberi TaxID=150374 RepID=A0A0M8N0V4_ESCWE|nr:hypothetical protein ESCO_003472 [Escovopsis weberi]
MADTTTSLSGDSTPRNIPQAVAAKSSDDDGKKEGKGKMRSIFGFGKKKTETSASASASSRAATGAGAHPPSLSKDSSGLSSTTTQSSSPPRRSPYEHSIATPTSPTRGFAGSPRVASPATSQIFERDVQDSAFVPRPTSSAIPNHIQTENYIPSVLDDASEAITNQRLDPDSVEIVTHTLHQPASVAMLATPGPYDQQQQQQQHHHHQQQQQQQQQPGSGNEWASELASFAERMGLPADSASNYGSLDSADIRRLSFISFADVVQSEHSSHHLVHVKSRDNLHMAGLTSLSPSALNRSPSPVRSPVSSQGPGTSPPTSNPGSIRGLDLSPPRKPLGSPTATHHTCALAPGELNIETMTQALRRTGSTDLSRYRSTPQSPVDGPGSR